MNVVNTIKDIFLKLGLKNRITINNKNPKTGDIYKTAVGFDFFSFIFAGLLFGILQFRRGLHIWGFFILISWSISMILNILMIQAIALKATNTPYFDYITLNLFLFQALLVCLNIYLGFKSNELTVKNYLNLGYEFVDNDPKDLEYAKSKWNINI